LRHAANGSLISVGMRILRSWKWDLNTVRLAGWILELGDLANE